MKAAPRGVGLVASLALHGLVAALLILWPVTEELAGRADEPEGLAIIYEGTQEAEGDATPPAPQEVAEAPPVPDAPPPSPPPPPPPVAEAPAPSPPAPPPMPMDLAEPMIPLPPPPMPVAEPQASETPPAPEAPKPEEAPQQVAETPPPQPTPPAPEHRAPPRPSASQAAASPVRLNAALQGLESFNLEGLTSAPEPLDTARNRRPNYPDASRRRGEQGVVRVELLIDGEGRVTNVRVVESSGFTALDNAAVEAVRDWRFRPARRGGVPVAGNITTSVHFRLETARR